MVQVPLNQAVAWWEGDYPLYFVHFIYLPAHVRRWLPGRGASPAPFQCHLSSSRQRQPLDFIPGCPRFVRVVLCSRVAFVPSDLLGRGTRMVHGVITVTALPFQGCAGCRRPHASSSSSSSSLKKCGGTLSFSANRAERAGLHLTTWTLTVLVSPRKSYFAGVIILTVRTRSYVPCYPAAFACRWCGGRRMDPF